MQVIQRVKEKITQIAPSLPKGVTIEPFYDRSSLIERTIETLRHALIEEILLVTLAHIIFLWHFRSILIVTLPLPISILISFILMQGFGITSNIMSLSGIAIAIGVLVDAGIVMTENVIRRCEQAEKTPVSDRRSATGARRAPLQYLEIIRHAAHQVGRPIFFAMAIIILAFLPVFALTGQEGKLFHPLAFTKTFAMIGATLLGVTLVPVLCSWLVRGPFRAENENVVMRFLMRLYRPALEFALLHGRIVLAAAAALLAAAVLLATRIGSEFMPPLNEGSLLFMPVLLPSTSLTEVKRVMAWQDRHKKHARSGVRRRQAGTCGDAHRSGAGGNDRDHYHTQAAGDVAARSDQRKDHRRAFGKTEPDSRLRARLSPADRKPHPYA
jgi:Cu(I)/Ag(I) efflux system membrane protein CusA/SilA